ncbi:MAG: ParA family protein, partial [Thauera sp.]
MKTIAFLSQKGGSGKTTLAVHTAVAALEDGQRVVIVDT